MAEGTIAMVLTIRSTAWTADRAGRRGRPLLMGDWDWDGIDTPACTGRRRRGAVLRRLAAVSARAYQPASSQDVAAGGVAASTRGGVRGDCDRIEGRPPGHQAESGSATRRHPRRGHAYRRVGRVGHIGGAGGSTNTGCGGALESAQPLDPHDQRMVRH